MSYRWFAVSILWLVACAPVAADPSAEPDLAQLTADRYDPVKLLVGLERGGRTDLDWKGRSLEPTRFLDRLDIGVYEVDPGEDVLQAIADLRRDPRVEWAEPNYYVHALETPNDPLFTQQYFHAKIGSEAAWDVSTGAGVLVAVIDTGVGPYAEDGLTHYREDLGYDFINNDDDPTDDHGHGSFIASELGAPKNNALGGAGVAPDAAIVGVKVLDSKGSGSNELVAAGIDWATSQGVDIINLSLGSGDDSTAIHEAVDAADAAGVAVFCAAGNENGALGYPARYDSVIAVGATDDRDVRSDFSNVGPELDLVAPGEVILAEFGDHYDRLTGTSFSAPIAAGVGALLSALGADNDEIRATLQATAVDLGAAGRDDWYGWGRVDAAAAVTAFVPPCGDADGDGVCDADDVCPTGDDALDDDGDGVPDACDVCPGYDDAADADADGIPDGCDADTTPPAFSSPTIQRFFLFHRVRFTTDEPARAWVCTETLWCAWAGDGTAHDTGWFLFPSRGVTLYAVDAAGNWGSAGPYSLPW